MWRQFLYFLQSQAHCVISLILSQIDTWNNNKTVINLKPSGAQVIFANKAVFVYIYFSVSNPYYLSNSDKHYKLLSQGSCYLRNNGKTL